jgi:hypothetical protein
MDPLSLDWGAATAEFQNDEAKSAVHIFNHDLSTPERVDRTIRFAQARLAWCALRLPGFAQEVWYDEREQKVEAPSREKIKARLAGKAAGLLFMSEGGE